MTPKHETATIYIPVEGSLLDMTIDPGSGIAGIRRQPSGMLVIYYEGNRFDAINMREGRERVTHAFGRLAVRYPTVAMQGVMPEDENQLIPVGDITWPSVIEFYSPDTEIKFNEYVARHKWHKSNPI